MIADDALGTNTIGLTGDDAALFELDGTGVYLKAGVVLDSETNPTLDVTVNGADLSVPGSTPVSTQTSRSPSPTSRHHRGVASCAGAVRRRARSRGSGGLTCRRTWPDGTIAENIARFEEHSLRLNAALNRLNRRAGT